MDVLHIDELKYPIGNGSTLPIIGVADNKPYVVKTFNNPEGNRVLINEIVSYKIIKKLELPIPKANICRIDENTLIDKNVTDREEFPTEYCGFGFCSEYIQKSATLSSSRMIKLSNNYRWIIPKIMIFDHIIYNKDRNRGNILITTNKEKKQLLVIDHSHTFNLECLWDSISLRQKIEENDYNDIDIMNSNKYLYSMFKDVVKMDIITMRENVEYFKKNLDDAFFKKSVEDIPNQWESNKKELEMLSDYLIYRFHHIDTYADIISSFKY